MKQQIESWLRNGIDAPNEVFTTILTKDYEEVKSIYLNEIKQ